MLTPPTADGLCAMTISTLGRSDTADWWEMWSAAAQLNGVCVKAGKKGKHPGLGESLRPFVRSSILELSCFKPVVELLLIRCSFVGCVIGEKMLLSIEVRGVWPRGSAVENGTVGSGDGDVSTS